MTNITIVIPSFNGRKILQKSLPVVIKNSPNSKIIVVDDGGSDQTPQFLRSNFPKVKVIRTNKNYGFPVSVNRGVAAATSEFVVLLNNDVYPEKGYLDEALKYFKDSDIFAVTFCEENSSWPQTSWYNGKLHYTQAADKTQAVCSTWASGGSCIVRRAVWQKLRGFNPIYSPGYWEDIDLGWRAYKAGYKIVWTPNARVIHQHESTFKKLNQAWVNLVKQRNELLFIWQNISDFKLIMSHLWFLKKYTLFHPGYLKVILSALSKLPEARINKIKVRSDKEILELVNQPLSHD